jgi:hypothetical protein
MVWNSWCFITAALNFTLRYAITKVQRNQEGLKLNLTHELLVYVNDVTLLGGNIDIIQKSAETLTDLSKDVCREINAEKT